MFEVRRFDPLDYSSLSESVADALMDCELVPLAEVKAFNGPGIYALFYHGPFPAYAELSNHETEDPGSWPIYIGKATPSTRMGKALMPDNFNGHDLYGRLRQHAQSIEQADNLSVSDFSAKMLILSYIWVPMAETAMIGRYQPLWNSGIDGFGNHNPGAGRHGGMCSRWDTLHPGRPWVKNFVPRPETQSDIEHAAVQFLRQTMN